MKIIDMTGKPCPIPVIETKKALSEPGADSVLVRVDNLAAVQNLEKMAKGSGCVFTYEEKTENDFDVTISLEGKYPALQIKEENAGRLHNQYGPADRLIIVISRNTLGEGPEELGKILMKGFIYSLTELSIPPDCVLFMNSGAFLTTLGANTLDDLKKLEEKETRIFTCGTCVNYFGLQDKLSVGGILNMFEITEKMASGTRVINL